MLSPARLDVQLACFRGWSEGIAAVLAVPSVDPMAPINDAGDTPLHWLCKAGSSWADVAVGGKSVDIYAAMTALMAPGELKPSQIRGVVTVRPPPLPRSSPPTGDTASHVLLALTRD